MALTYCNTQTAGLNFSGMSFVIAFTFSYLFTSIPDIIKIKSTRTWYLMPLLILPLICIQKYQEPYEWWGLAQSSIPQAKYSLLSQKTKGMHVDKMTKTIFNTINTSIKQFSKTNNDVYLFPDIPIFYYLNDKIPPYKNPVLWFDVISSQHIKEELINFKQHLPEVIVFLDPPDFVYAGHANLIKRSLIQLKFKHLFEHLVDQGIYRLHKNIIYCQKLNDLFYTDKSLKRTIILKNKAFDNKSLGEIHSIINDKASFIITGIIKQGVLITNLNNQIRIKRNDMLIIKTTKADLKKLAENLGYIINSDYYTLKIYVKNHPK